MSREKISYKQIGVGRHSTSAIISSPAFYMLVRLHETQAMATQTYRSTRGYHYPKLVSSRTLSKHIAVVDKDLPNKLPTIDMSTKFDNPNHADIHTASVVVGQYRYVVVGYMDPNAHTNLNLLEICPEVPWKGELAVFSAGKHARILSRTVGSKRILRRAIRLYISQCMEAHAHGQLCPIQMTE